MWRILSILSTIVLAVSVWVGLLNQDHIKAESADLANNQQRLTKTNQLIEEENTLIAQANETRTSAEAEAKKFSADAETLKVKNDELTGALAAVKEQLPASQASLADAAKKGEALPDLDALEESIKTLKQESDSLAQEVSSSEAKLAASDASIKGLEESVARAEGVEDDVRRRVSSAGLHARVSTVHPAMGFVIINAGITNGVVPGSRLAVMRGAEKIAELSVSAVERNRTSADIVPDTLVANQEVQPGDSIVAIRPVAPVVTAETTKVKVAAPKKVAVEEDIFGDSAAADEAVPATEADASVDSAPAASEEASTEADPFAE